MHSYRVVICFAVFAVTVNVLLFVALQLWPPHP
jgi:hypothetical protein